MPLKVSQGAGEWAKHFMQSDDPRFKGKSQKQRQKQGLAAWYAAKRAGKESLTEDELNSLILQSELGVHAVEPKQKVIENKVFEAIFSDLTEKILVYAVKVQYTTPENDVAKTRVIDVRAESPEAAKSQAVALAKQMNLTNCSVQGVDVLGELGAGFPTTSIGKGAADAQSGMVTPSVVSPSLSNQDRQLPSDSRPEVK